MTGTKKSLLASGLSLAVSAALLIGTTFAWFTDSVTNTGNKIQAGKLSISAAMYDLQEKAFGDDEMAVILESMQWDCESMIYGPNTLNLGEDPYFALGFGEKGSAGKDFEADESFIADTLFEPGKTYVRMVRVKNDGNLAAKVKFQFDITDDGLVDALWFAVLCIKDGAGGLSFQDIDERTRVSAINETLESHEISLKPNGDYADIAFIFGMDEEAGNEFKNKSFDTSLSILATQYTYEKDGFGDDQYDKDAAIKTASSLEELFPDVDFDFGFNNVASEPISLDGKGVAFVDKWTDAWLSSDTTIKGVTFKNGAVFSAKADNITVTLEDCTFYACDQTKLVYTNNNSLTNSGAGMCLNLEKSDKTGVKFIVKNCKFIGENDPTLPVDGPKYEADGSSYTTKKRGHAIALDAICGGGTGTLDSLLIEGCTIDGVRGHAIQLYGNTGDITIKNTNINSWGVNRDHVGAAIRGDYGTTTSRTITLENVYFGLNETGTIGADTNYIGHVYVGEYPGNTDGSRTAGTYYSVTP